MPLSSSSVTRHCTITIHYIIFSGCPCIILVVSYTNTLLLLLYQTLVDDMSARLLAERGLMKIKVALCFSLSQNATDLLLPVRM